MLYYAGFMTLLAFIMTGICSILDDKLEYQKALVNGLRARRDQLSQREFSANSKVIEYQKLFEELEKVNDFGAESVEKLQHKIKEILEKQTNISH